MKRIRVVAVLFSAIAVVLEALPWGAKLRFADPEGADAVSCFSYFDPITYGYADFAPLVCAALTVCTVVLLIVRLFVGKALLDNVAAVFSFLAALASFWAMLTNFGVLSSCIFLSLALCVTCVIFPKYTK